MLIISGLAVKVFMAAGAVCVFGACVACAVVIIKSGHTTVIIWTGTGRIWNAALAAYAIVLIPAVITCKINPVA